MVAEETAMPYANNQGVRIHYEVMGVGSPLVLHHQALGNGKDWASFGYAGVLAHNHQLLLIDAKASQEPFDVGTDTLRSLQEYTQRQLRRQTGDLDLNATLLVANEFRQDEARLSAIGNDFLGAARIPLAFLRTASLVTMVDSLRENLSLRNKIRWQQLFCRVGMISAAHFLAELAAAKREHVAG